MPGPRCPILSTHNMETHITDYHKLIAVE
jgi:hypothetical protein